MGTMTIETIETTKHRNSVFFIFFFLALPFKA